MEGYGAPQPMDRPWSEYPVGTRALALMGGYWTKEGPSRWRWMGGSRCPGSAFPTPGGDAFDVRLPLLPGEAEPGKPGELDY